MTGKTEQERAPDKRILAFLQSLPATIKKQFLFGLVSLLNFARPVELEDSLTSGDDEAEIQKLLTSECGLDRLGATVCLCALIDFSFARLNHAVLTPEVAQQFETEFGSNEMAKRHVAEQWNELRRGPLSEQKLFEFAEWVTTVHEPEPPQRTVE